jgi:hypothetical protein
VQNGVGFPAPFFSVLFSRDAARGNLKLFFPAIWYSSAFSA